MDADIRDFLDRKPLDDEALRRVEQQYPFFTLPLAEAASREEDAERRAVLLARVALTSPDTETLMRLADRQSDVWMQFYPPDKPQPVPTTEDAISTFLDTYGHGSDKENDLLERLIFNPVPADYASTIDEEDKPRERDAQDDIIDAFLTNLEQTEVAPEPAPEPVVETAPHSDSLSESLAKIYIRQQRYDKAFEIISTLSLNFPKKSVYFADQLRFLKKLMLNAQHTL